MKKIKTKQLAFFLTILGFICFFFLRWESIDPKKENKDKRDSKPLIVQVTSLGKMPWDPQTSNQTKQIFNSAVHLPLIKISENFELEKGVFKDWVWESGSRSYTLTLAENLTFHDGQKLKIEDVEYAILRKFFEDEGDFERDFLNQIVGIDKLRGNHAFSEGSVEGIQRISDQRLKIVLKQNDPYFLYKLSLYSSPVQPKKSALISDDTSQFPIGLGPYRVVNFSREGVSVVVKRVNSCEDCPNLIKFVEIGDPKKNRVDIGCGPTAKKLFNYKDYEYQRGRINSSMVVLDFNFSNKWAKKIEVRSLVARAIDRKMLFQHLPSTVPSYSLIPIHLYGRLDDPFNTNKPLVDRDKIQKEFSKSPLVGWYHGLPGSETPAYVKEVQMQLARVGLDVNLKPTLQHSFTKDDSKVSFYIYRMGGLVADPTILLSTYIENEVRSAHAPSINESLRKYLTLFREQPSTFKKAKILEKIQKVFHENYIQVPLGASFPSYVTSPRVKTLQIGKQGYTIDFDLVTLSE